MIPAGAFRESIAGFLAPIRAHLDDDSVSEVMINSWNDIWIERGGSIERSPTRFPSREALVAALTNIAQFSGRPFDEGRPILEAHLPDGSRLEAVLDPIAERGPVVAIRRFSRSTLTVGRLVELGSLTREAALFLGRAIRAGRNTVVSGGTGTGKTSLLGALSSFVPDNERILVLEDTRELALQKEHVVYLETRSADDRGRGRVSLRDLLRATLRLRPDRIVVGEIRGAEAIDLVQAMNTGHRGSMTTVHANSPRDALRRIETMAVMADSGLPLEALRTQISSAVDLVVQAERTPQGRRRVGGICALANQGDGRTVRTLFSRDREGNLAFVSKKKKGNNDEKGES